MKQHVAGVGSSRLRLCARSALIGLAAASFTLLDFDSAHAQGQAQSLGQDANQQASDLLRHFGVGLSLTHDTGGADRIEDAQIVDGLVRVTRDSNTRARVMLEWHAWMFCEHLDKDEIGDDPTYRTVKRKRGYKQVPPCRPNRRASGAFVAVQPGSDSIIDAIGLGWMLRFPDKLQMFGNRTLNVGFGLIADHNVKVLGDGFVENQAPPSGISGEPETQVRYRTTTQSGIFAMASLELGQTPVQIPRGLTFYTDARRDRPPTVNDSVNLYWSVDNVDKCVASDSWTGDRELQGQEQIKLTTAGTLRFTLTCSGRGRSLSRFVEVDVAAAAPPSPPAGGN